MSTGAVGSPTCAFTAGRHHYTCEHMPPTHLYKGIGGCMLCGVFPLSALSFFLCPTHSHTPPPLSFSLTLTQCLGLAPEVVDTCFKGTASRIGGVGFTQLAADAFALHEAAYKVGF